jgi:hypothetical protein
MDILQVLTIVSVAIANIVTTIGLFIWAAKTRASEVRVDTVLTSIRDEIASIKEEIKDFHGRLCAIEERRN